MRQKPPKLAPLKIELTEVISQQIQSLKNLTKISQMKNLFKNIIFSLVFFALISSCKSEKKSSDLPAWYLSPKQNNSSSLYGVSEGFTLEEATKSALADAAARLIVSISSESVLLREENQNSANEEMRQQIKQNIEKIDFTNFKVSRSQQIGAQIYVEVEISRPDFIAAQKEKMSFLDKQIFDLNKNISTQNLIQKRNSLTTILDLAKQSEILARILQSNLKEKLTTIANAQNELNKLTDKVEFYFEINSPNEISAIIRSALNKERIKISRTESFSANQVKIAISSKSTSGNVYGAHISKIKIDFENKVAGKTIASNAIEISGSSSISEKESYSAALESLKEKISQDGILKILGIVN